MISLNNCGTAIHRHLKTDRPVLADGMSKLNFATHKQRYWFFLKEYKGIKKDDKLGDLYPWSLIPDGSIRLIFSPIGNTLKIHKKLVFLLLLKKGIVPKKLLLLIISEDIHFGDY
jgi:hypothetical protein